MESICVGKDIIECKLPQSPVIVLECFAGLCFFYAAGFSSGHGAGTGRIRYVYECHSLQIMFDINITIMIFYDMYLVLMCLPQPRNLRHLPGPPVYILATTLVGNHL